MWSRVRDKFNSWSNKITYEKSSEIDNQFLDAVSYGFVRFFRS